MRTSTATVAMGVRPHPMESHPFLLDVEVDRSFDGDRLAVTSTATSVDALTRLEPGQSMSTPWGAPLT